MSQNDDKERRSHPRRKIQIPIQIKLKSYDEFMGQFVTDISAGGLFIATPTPYEPGDVVDIEFYLEMQQRYFFKVRGEVTRVNNNPRGMGVRFTEIEEGSQELLDKLLQEEQPETTQD